MIPHIHLVRETVFSHFITNFSTEWFFDETSKEFFVLHEKSIEIQTKYE